jgi:hypothetical protein
MLRAERFVGLVAMCLMTACVAGSNEAAQGEEHVGTAQAAVTAPSAPQKLTAPDGLAGDWYGGAVSMSEERALVGAPYATIDHVSYQGAAYVYARKGDAWTQEAKLVVPDGNADAAAWSVALDGDRAAIGAPLALANGQSRGAVFVFERGCGGAWKLADTVTAPDGAAGDNFGNSVGLSRGTLVVGAPFAPVNGTGQGAVYVFRHDGAGSHKWREAKKLVAADGTPGSSLGYFVAVDGDTIAAGAPFQGPGLVYVYERGAQDAWAQRAELAPLAGTPDGELFGASVSVRGGRILVGAPGDGTGGLAYRGAVFDFEIAKSKWTLARTLLAADASSGDYFGMGVAQSDQWVVCGAWFATVDGREGQGAAYAYPVHASGLGTPVKLVAPDGAANDQFGLAVGTGGSFVLAGAFEATVGSNAQQGAAYAFDMRH